MHVAALLTYQKANLLLAAFWGQTKKVQDLILKENVDPTLQNKVSVPPLTKSYLIAYDSGAPPQLGDTALHIASKQGHSDLVEVLLSTITDSSVGKHIALIKKQVSLHSQSDVF